MSKLQLALTSASRLLLFIFIFIISFFIVGVFSYIITLKFGATTPALRIITIIQDVMFIVPPVLTAVMVTRQPATLLCIDRAPNVKLLLLAICALLASIPAMDYIIYLNQNVSLPETWAAWFTELEDNATSTIRIMYGDHTVANLIMTILIVGIMAGLSEELLFRGGLQRLLSTGGINANAAVWITAAVFSLIHMQFYGFVPRMLLGAFFGYLLVWTRTLWIPIILHIANNTIYVIAEWIDYGSSQPEQMTVRYDSIADYGAIAVSAIATALILYFIAKLSPHQDTDK